MELKRESAPSKPSIFISKTASDFDGSLSDHKQVITDVATDLQLLTWNIMTRCKSSADGRANNGFKKNENITRDMNEDKYFQRLKNCAKKLGATLGANPAIGIITLQEVPLKKNERALFFKELHNYLGSNWHIDDTKLFAQTGRNFGVLTLINKDYVTDYKRAEVQGLTVQSDRVLMTDFELVPLENSNQKRYLRIANVHFKQRPERSPEDDHSPRPYLTEIFQKEINKLLQSASEGQVIVVGDFNHPLDNFKMYKIKAPENETAQSASRKISKIDGVIFKETPEAYPLTTKIKSNSMPTAR